MRASIFNIQETGVRIFRIADCGFEKAWSMTHRAEGQRKDARVLRTVGKHFAIRKLQFEILLYALCPMLYASQRPEVVQ